MSTVSTLEVRLNDLLVGLLVSRDRIRDIRVTAANKCVAKCVTG